MRTCYNVYLLLFQNFKIAALLLFEVDFVEFKSCDSRVLVNELNQRTKAFLIKKKKKREMQTIHLSYNINTFHNIRLIV